MELFDVKDERQNYMGFKAVISPKSGLSTTHTYSSAYTNAVMADPPDYDFMAKLLGGEQDLEYKLQEDKDDAI